MGFFHEFDVVEAPKVKIFNDETVGESCFNFLRKYGFPYPGIPPHMAMQEINALASTADETLLRTTTAYIVADTYHLHRWHAAANGMKSPIQAFQSDKDLKKAIALSLKFTGGVGLFPSQLRLVNGTQACSNFRPGFALFLYRKFCPPGGVVLDTSTGYGGRLVGFFASEASRYIGFDPNTLTHYGNSRMIEDLLPEGKTACLVNLPIEDGDIDGMGIADSVDLAFTSPPYFHKELYSDEPTQSCNRYPTGRDWCNGFLLPMMRFQFRALKPGSKAIVNIADVKLKHTRDLVYPLVEWTKKAGEKVGFAFLGERSFMLNYRFGSSTGVAKEPVLVFQKPGV